MIIGVKYWDQGDSAPVTWIDLDVLECYARPWRKSYLRAEAMDGFNLNYRRKFIRVVLKLSPLAMNTPAVRTIIEAMADAYYIRVHDTRFAYLDNANVIDLVHTGDTDWTRSAPSQATEEGMFELVSESPL